MYEQVEETVARYEELNRLFASPEVVQDPDKIRQYAQERAEIEDLVLAYSRYKELAAQIDDTRILLDEGPEAEFAQMVQEELAALEAERDQAEQRLRELLIPVDPRDKRNVIVEIRAGAGGDEAGLFAADLFRMYAQYAAANGWQVQVLSSNETGIGGFKEIVFEVQGKGVFSRLKYESGVHRVQRVPTTEASGRIHTSTATVAVLPEVDEVEVEIDERDLRVDVFRAGGHGGQSVNTTDSAVRITHLPTGIVTQCQDERSQLQNRARALSILRARLYDLEYQRQFNELDESRRRQVGSGERSEKIRTYNFPQNRVTDHRTGLSVYQLEEVLAGGIDPFVEEMIAQERAAQLSSA